MQYLLSFLEGIITFISPCLLPMLPVYIAWLAGEQGGRRRAVTGAAGFVLGFTLVFLAMGAFAGVVGGLLVRWQTVLGVITGAVVVLFGLSYLGVIRLPAFGGMAARREKSTGFFPAVLFGLVFSLAWTPCVGAFLGSALALAAGRGTAGEGMLLLLCYSLGLGIPFVLSALLLERLSAAFEWIKKHYKAITTASGILLIVVGVLMMTGLFGRWLALLS